MDSISKEELTLLVARALGIPAQDVTGDLGPANAIAWDSLTHIAIFTELEEHLGRTFTADQILETRSFLDLCQLTGLSHSDSDDD